MGKNEIKGVGILAGVGILYSCYGVFSKLMGDAFAPFYQTWSRALICFFILLLIISTYKQYRSIEKKDIPWFFLIGFCGGMTDTLFYIAVTHISLGVTLFLFYAFITLVSYIFGKILFHERLTKFKIISIIGAIVGIAFLYFDRIAFIDINPVYIFFASTAGAFAGTYYSLNKKISNKYSNYQIAASNNLVGFFIMGLISIFLKEPLNTNLLSFPWLINILFACVQTIVMVLLVLGFRFVEVQKGSLILLLEPVLAIVWGYLLFHETLGFTTVIGCIFILIAMILPIIEPVENSIKKEGV